MMIFLVPLPMVGVITDHREWILWIGDNTNHGHKKYSDYKK